MNLKEIQSVKLLDKYLAGKVFHATPLENLRAIQRAGGLYPNVDMQFKSDFGNTEGGYFRQKGCVSFFDYRDFGSKKWKEFSSKCRPTQILIKSTGIAILVLSQDQFQNLIPWTLWKQEESCAQIVPYIETGLKGFVSISYITDVFTYKSME